MDTVLADRYELGRALGRGGMAEVWEARDVVLGRAVAVKTVDLAATHDPTLGDRLHREAVATAALDHPDIVTVYDAGVDGDTAFLVMELLGGRDLAAVLRSGQQLAEAEALRVGSRIAGALAVAHAAGIVHRDIKPANILLDGEKVTVVDFGIAAVEHAAAASLTGPGATLGTAEYMAPEQARAEPVTSGTDMYSFGCLMTTLLAGRPPFTGQPPIVLLQQHVADEPPRLKDLRPGISPEVDDLVTALLAKNPEDRPSALQAHEVLARLAAEQNPGLGVAAPPPVDRAAEVAAAIAAAETARRSERRAARTSQDEQLGATADTAAAGAAAGALGPTAGMAALGATAGMRPPVPTAGQSAVASTPDVPAEDMPAGEAVPDGALTPDGVLTPDTARYTPAVAHPPATEARNAEVAGGWFAGRRLRAGALAAVAAVLVGATAIALRPETAPAVGKDVSDAAVHKAPISLSVPAEPAEQEPVAEPAAEPAPAPAPEPAPAQAPAPAPAPAPEPAQDPGPAPGEPASSGNGTTGVGQGGTPGNSGNSNGNGPDSNSGRGNGS